MFSPIVIIIVTVIVVANIATICKVLSQFFLSKLEKESMGRSRGWFEETATTQFEHC